MEIVKFESKMQPQAIAFFEKCYKALGWGYEPNGRHSDTARIAEFYADDGCFWCMTDGDEIVGTAALHVFDYEKRIFELKRMFVLPQYQNKGIGGALLNCAISYAKQKQYHSIYLDTRNDLTAAQHLYEKNGFKKIEQYNLNLRADLYYKLKLN